MADISVMNVGGTDYNLKDSTSRTNSTKAMSLPAYYETGNTASQAYSIVGTPINWKGTLYYTKTTVAKGATWAVGTNLTAATNLGKLVRNIKTYVGSDSKLHFVDLTGADTALNFSGTTYSDIISPSTSTTTKVTCGFKPNYIICISSTTDQGFLYDADYSTNVSRSFNGGGNSDVSLGVTTNGQLYSIDNDGFTMNKVSTSRTYYIFASK